MSTDTSTWTGALLWAAVAFLAVATINVLIGRSSRRSQRMTNSDKANAHRQRIRFTAQIAQIVTAVVGLVLFAHAIPALRPVGTALLASASVITIVVGVAAQTTLGNVLAGVSILMFRPFEAGDRIQLMGPNGPEIGIVETMNLGNTVVSTFDNRRVVVPNGQLVNQTTINLSSVTEAIMATITVKVARDSNVQAVKALLQDIIEAHPDSSSFDSAVVSEIGPYYVAISLYAWCPDSFAARRLEYAVYEAALQTFPAAGIEVGRPDLQITHTPGLTDD